LFKALKIIELKKNSKVYCNFSVLLSVLKKQETISFQNDQFLKLRNISQENLQPKSFSI